MEKICHLSGFDCIVFVSKGYQWSFFCLNKFAASGERRGKRGMFGQFFLRTKRINMLLLCTTGERFKQAQNNLFYSHCFQQKKNRRVFERYLKGLAIFVALFCCCAAHKTKWNFVWKLLLPLLRYKTTSVKKKGGVEGRGGLSFHLRRASRSTRTRKVVLVDVVDRALAQVTDKICQSTHSLNEEAGKNKHMLCES